MRPEYLNDLFSSLSRLPGLGAKLEKTLSRLLKVDGDTPARIIDLLFHLPSAIIDRRNQPGIAHAQEGAIVTLKVSIDRHQPAPRGNRRAPHRIYVHDETGEMALVFFHANSTWLERSLPISETRYISGKVEWFNGAPQIIHPDYIVTEDDFQHLPKLDPIYPMTAGISHKVLRRAIIAALEYIPTTLTEWIDPHYCKQQQFPSFTHALHTLHTPEEPSDIDTESPSRRRLAYDEYLATQLALTLLRQHHKNASGRIIQGNGEITTKILNQLPFSLTASQRKSLDDIQMDFAKPERMLRLLQGDVGSGKTIVALLAMANVIEAGGQAALMAPTEILARQHYNTIEPLAVGAGLHIALLTGRDKGKARSTLLSSLAEGTIDILIGTHALFQDDVIFHDLAFSVIDEQHRFGVHQRLALASKGKASDMLVMTATPIPRTLVMTHYGDMDVSNLYDKPAGRQPIDTRIISLERLDKIVERIAAALQKGAKIYWICPLVDESEILDVTAAEERHTHLTSIFGKDRMGLVHGRMKADEKDAAMQDFQQGKTRILVATTVIEVGVDVPDATIMVIEHAERFGLAQLHQLRGRVGRGSERSSCLLVFKAPLGEVAHARLSILRDTDDGFRIAEEDLRLRGEGEVLGTRQSGLPGFRLIQPETHSDLLEVARDDARLIIETDPGLSSPRGQALRSLLYLFSRDDAIRLIRAG